jgi:hypothetical protein
MAFPFPRALKQASGFLPSAKIPTAPNSELTSPAQLSLLYGFSISPRPEASFGIFAFGKDPYCSKFRTNKPCAAEAAQRLFHSLRPEASFGDFCLRQRSILLQIPNQQALRS